MKFAFITRAAQQTFRLSTLTVAIWLSGCTVGPDFVRPEAPAGQQVTRAPMVTTDNSPVAAGAAQRDGDDAGRRARRTPGAGRREHDGDDPHGLL